MFIIGFAIGSALTSLIFFLGITHDIDPVEQEVEVLRAENEWLRNNQ